MASFTFVLIAVSLLATCSAAPQKTKSGIIIPEECKGKVFCSIRPEGYDEIEAKINKLLPGYLIEFNNRISSGPILPQPEDDDDNCPSEVTWESLYTVNSTGTEVDIVVQTKIFPQQYAKVTCKHSQSQITSIKDGSPQCFRKLELDTFLKFSCQESTAKRTLIIYDPQEDGLKTKSYDIPVCCSCKISKNEEIPLLPETDLAYKV